MATRNLFVTIIYGSFQAIIALLVSIIGAIQVARYKKRMKKQSLTQMEKEIAINTESNNEMKEEEFNHISPDNANTVASYEPEKGFCKLWAKTAWKMRGIYAGLAVHSFDVLTDILVLLQWLNTPNIEGDHIDPQIMAYSAMSILVISKVISSIGIYIKDANIIRSILQLFDLLIFVEIYQAHAKVLSKIRNKDPAPVDSTLSFKYIRNFEAIFESIPQSILQLVYVIRTGETGTDIAIFAISIIQSIVSMTNSVINSDNTQMVDDKWKKYRQRFPPTKQFAKHALCRFSEVIYRIGLLSLFWSICEGYAFCILLGFEIFIITACRFIQVKGLTNASTITIDSETLLLSLSWLINVPSEEFYWGGTDEWREYFGSEGCDVVIIAANICCCVGLSAFMSAIGQIILMRDIDVEIPKIPAVRIGLSLMEFIFLFFWALFIDERKQFLFSFHHGLFVFIITSIFFIIYAQYPLLFPDFSLPWNVSVRSKWGYAFANELTELQRIQIPHKRMPYSIPNNIKKSKISKRNIFLNVMKDEVIRDAFIKSDYIKNQIITNQNLVQYIDDFSAEKYEKSKKNRKTDGEEQKTEVGIYEQLYEIFILTINHLKEYNVVDTASFWDEPVTINYLTADYNIYSSVYSSNKAIVTTAAVFALAKGNHDIVEWLEEQGAISHKGIKYLEAKAMVFGNNPLPFSVEIRSKYAHAYLNELYDLKQMKIPKGQFNANYCDINMSDKIFRKIMKDTNFCDSLIKSNVIKKDIINNQHLAKYVDEWNFNKEIYKTKVEKERDSKRKDEYEILEKIYVNILEGLKSCDISNPAAFWDQPVKIKNGIIVTAAVFALAEGHNGIVKWLEEQGAIAHKGMDLDTAKWSIYGTRLPFNVPFNSKWSYAWRNKLDALKTIVLNEKQIPSQKRMEEFELFDVGNIFEYIISDNDFRLKLIESDEIKQAISNIESESDNIQLYFNNPQTVENSERGKVVFGYLECDFKNNEKVINLILEFGEMKIIDDELKEKLERINKTVDMTVDYLRYYNITNATQFWDEPIGYMNDRISGWDLTSAVLALAHENYKVVEWLEEQGAVRHKGMDVNTAKHLLGKFL